MMGRGLTYYLDNRIIAGGSEVVMKSISMYYNKNIKLRTTINPEESFMLEEIPKDKIDKLMHIGEFLNRQKVGLRVRDFDS